MARYIDADKLNEILVSGFIDENDALVESPTECNSMLVWAIQEAKGMPTADVRENVHGKWEYSFAGNWKCSVCGDEPYYDSRKGLNFCPNCGARMESE